MAVITAGIIVIDHIFFIFFFSIPQHITSYTTMAFVFTIIE